MKRLFHSRPALVGRCRLAHLVIVLAGALINLPTANAHQALDVQIQRLSERVAKAPDDLSALLRRADLYRRHKNWRAALDDYDRAAQLSSDYPVINLGRAQTYFDQDKLDTALHWAQRLLRLSPEHAQGLLLKARILLASGDIDSATSTFEKALKHIKTLTPGHYLDYANTILADLDRNAHQRAIAVLDKGASQLANTVSLHNRAVELEIDNGDFGAALKRTQQILKGNRKLLNWRLREGELLLRLQRTDEARRVFTELLAELHSLPPQRRSSRAMTNIAQQSQMYLIALTRNKLH